MPYGQDDAVTNGGYGQDPEVQGDASQWGPVSEAANGAMFGMGPTVDEWIGHHAPTWLTGGNEPSAAQEEANQQAWEQQHPYQSTAANVVGGAVPFLATDGIAGGLGLLGRAGAMATTGAVGNSLKPISQGQNPTQAAVGGALMGAGGELGGSALAGAGGKLADALINKGVNIPSAASLKNLANSQYDNLTTHQASMPLSEGARFGQDTLDRFGQKWLDDTRAAKEFSSLANPPSNAVNVTAGGLEHARQNLNEIIRTSPGTAEAAAARMGKQSIDDLVTNKAATDPLWQNFSDLATAARGNWQAAKGSGTITGAVDKAVGRAGTNLVDNSPQLISKRAQSLLENPRLTQGLPQDALDQVQDVAHMGLGRKLLSSLGAASGHTGVGLSTAVPVALLEAVHNGLSPETVGVGLGAAGLGVASHALNKALAKRGMNAADETIRQASPAFRAAVASGASSAPVDVGPAAAAARKLSAALAASSGNQINAP